MLAFGLPFCELLFEFCGFVVDSFLACIHGEFDLHLNQYKQLFLPSSNQTIQITIQHLPLLLLYLTSLSLFPRLIYFMPELLKQQYKLTLSNFMKLKETNNSKKDKTLMDRKPSNIVVRTQLENSFDSRWAEIKIEGKNIPSRSKHASVIHKDKLYVHGGFDADKGILADFSSIEISQKAEEYRWTRLNNQCEGEQIKLKSHTAEVYGENIYLFGGEKSPINSSNLVYCYSIINDTWQKIKPNINLPKVDAHASIIEGSKVYFYGGYIPEEAVYNTHIYAFDLEMKTWEQYYKGRSSDKEPQGRSDFDMVVKDGSLWIFGGSDGKKTLSDFWKFNLKQKKWSLIQVKDGPQGRRGHSMLCYNEYIFMFGGIQDVTKEKNDVYIYQSSTNHWDKIHTTTNSIYDCSPTLKKEKKSTSPSKINIMKVEAESEGKDIDPMQKIINENRQKKFNERKKELLKQFEEQPHSKTKRSHSPTTESMLKTLESIGLQDNSKNEIKQEIIYDESHRFIIGKKPCARDGQSVNIFESKMFIFGGDRHLMAFNDLYFFDLDKGIKSLLLYHEK